MPRTVLHRAPVVVFHPVHHQPVACFRGMEIADGDPIATHPDFSWLFQETPEPEKSTSVRVDGPVEQATAAPGEKRTTRR